MLNVFARLLSWIGFALAAGFILVTTVRADPTAPEAEAIIAKNHFRPRDASVLAAHSSRFPAVKTFTVEETLGGWTKVQAEHFADGGIYDLIVTRR